MSLIRFPAVSLLLLLMVSATDSAFAQNNSLNRAFLGSGDEGLQTVASMSSIRTPPVAPRPIQEHDMVVVRVEELARFQSDAQSQRRKTGNYQFRIADWFRLAGLRKMEPTQQSGGPDPEIEGLLNQQMRTQGDLKTSERLTFDIAVEIVEIRPNGTLVLEGHKEVTVNEEVWVAQLTGVCRQEDIGKDNVILSRNIGQLKIDRFLRGEVRDAYKRGWFQKALDQVHPF